MADLADFDSPLTAALSVDDRDSLLNALKNKLNLGGFHADVLGSLSPKVRKRVDALREFQGEHDKLEANFFEERAALEAKYQKLYEPLYTKRYEIVSGIVEVDGVINETSTALTEEKGVPDFWLNAMKSNEILAEEITERDEGALKYLKDIKWCRVNDPKGFKLEFFFDANPYFENTILTKTYHMVEDEEPILENAIGMEIEWYPGKILTRKILKKNPNKSGSKSEDCPSFFNFFNPPQVPDYDDEILDEEAAEELQSQMEHDYDIGSTIRDKIVPRAVSWFTGEAVQFDEYDDMEEGDNENEDEDEEREGDKAEKKKIERSKAGEDQQDERPPECKQQ